MMQSDQPEEPKKRSKKDRKGKKDKKKRDKGSNRKGKGKGKGKKGSRKSKNPEEALENVFLRVSTTLPEYLSQEPFRPTERTPVGTAPEAIVSTEAPGKTFMEMPTHEPDSIPEAPSVVPSVLPESKVPQEVDKLPRRSLPPPHS